MHGANRKWKKTIHAAWRPLHSMIAITLSNNTAAAWKKHDSQAFSYFTQQLVFQLFLPALHLHACNLTAGLGMQACNNESNLSDTTIASTSTYVHSMHNAWLIVFQTILSDTKQLIQHLLLLETRFATHRWRRTMSFN